VQTDQLKARSLELFTLISASIVIWWQPLVATAKIALSSDAHTHILLVLPLSIALIYSESRRSALKVSRNWAAIVLLVVALLLRISAAWITNSLSANDKVSLSMAALVTWWLGTVLVCFGSGIFRRLLFPLGFLVLLIPFPDGVLSRVTEFLQYGSARATAVLFRFAQVPVTRDGILVSIPGLTVEVAQECSSIRSSMMLLLTTLILAHLFLRSWWSKTLLTLAVIPLSVAKNAIRIFTIAELTTRVDPSFLEGRLHRNGGVVFLTLAVVAVIFLLWSLRKGESRILRDHSLIA
jgi:exosortase